MESRKRKPATATSNSRAQEKQDIRHHYPSRKAHSIVFSSIFVSKSKANAVGVDSRGYLPRDVIYNILTFIPADALFAAMRYVCKQWNDIISDPIFARAHCQRFTTNWATTTGFLVQDCEDKELIQQITYIQAYTRTLQQIDTELPFPTTILCCLNGLVLISDSTNREIFHVVNPLTKVKISLPPVTGLRERFSESAGLAVDSSGHYKVLHVSCEVFDIEQLQMRVFTIGVDKTWRFIGIPVDIAAKYSTIHQPYCFGRFIYWFGYFTFLTHNPIGLALDVDTETIYRFPNPTPGIKDARVVRVVSLGTSLGVIDRSSSIWRLWKLTDVEFGEWTELGPIDVERLHCRLQKMFGCRLQHGIYPMRLFEGDLWFYCYVDHKGNGVRYNLANETLEFFPMKRVSGRTLYPHAGTLISPKKLLASTRLELD